MSDVLKEMQRIVTLAGENGQLRRQVITLRYIIARCAPLCLHCVAEGNQSCPVGFPGCGKVDDVAIAEAELPDFEDLKERIDQILLHKEQYA